MQKTRILFGGLGVVAMVALAACGAARSAGGSACTLPAQDSVYLSRGPVYRDCAVTTKAKIIPASRRLDYTLANTGRTCSMAEVELVVDTLGVPEPESIRIIRTNDPRMAEAVTESARSWRFEPARLNNAPVRQIVLERPIVSVMRVERTTASPPSRPPAGARAPTC